MKARAGFLLLRRAASLRRRVQLDHALKQIAVAGREQFRRRRFVRVDGVAHAIRPEVIQQYV